MFENWQAVHDPKPWRTVEPPRPVTVDLATAIAHGGGRLAHDLPLRVRADGLNLDVQVPGVLHAWARTSRGAWLGACTFTIPTGNKLGSLNVTQWCPATAITPRESDRHR
jgi:hypothetical protein